jgi:hypothetical protein
MIGLNDLNRRIGQHHQNAVLTDLEVKLMLDLRWQGFTYDQLKDMFEVSKSCVQGICSGRRRGQCVVKWRDDCCKKGIVNGKGKKQSSNSEAD